jgi:EPS-associated MarR family transcriptional regulator
MNNTNQAPHTREEAFQILRMLSNGKHLNQRQLSDELGFSLGKTNYLLKNLAKIGLIELKNFSTKNKKTKKIRYLLTKKGLKQKINLTYKYMKQKESEYRELKKELEGIEVRC